MNHRVIRCLHGRDLETIHGCTWYSQRRRKTEKLDINMIKKIFSFPSLSLRKALQNWAIPARLHSHYLQYVQLRRIRRYHYPRSCSSCFCQVLLCCPACIWIRSTGLH